VIDSKAELRNII